MSVVTQLESERGIVIVPTSSQHYQEDEMNKKNITCPISISKNNFISVLFPLLEASLNRPTYNGKSTTAQILIRKIIIKHTLQRI